MITKRNYIVTGIGKAYAFFDCRASKEKIETELNYIRDAVETPRELELSLTENLDELIGFRGALRLIDPNLSQIAREAKEAGIRYAMEAKYPNATNKKTADELSAVLNQAYQSDLYQKDEGFRGWIFYEDNGQYVERE